MTSNHHAPYGLATHVLQWRPQRAATLQGGANPQKAVPVRIGVCIPDSVKMESLVIADQHAA